MKAPDITRWDRESEIEGLLLFAQTVHSGLGSAFYCFLLLRQPVSIVDEGINPIPMDRYATPANRKDRHHIFPRRLLRGLEFEQHEYNSICNICLLTAEENQTIGFRRPWSYLGNISGRKGLFKKKMKKHLIPVDNSSGIWEHDISKGFKRFVREREEYISKSLEVEAGIRLFRRNT
jgi:hypothetical protein